MNTTRNLTPAERLAATFPPPDDAQRRVLAQMLPPVRPAQSTLARAA